MNFFIKINIRVWFRIEFGIGIMTYFIVTLLSTKLGEVDFNGITNCPSVQYEDAHPKSGVHRLKRNKILLFSKDILEPFSDIKKYIHNIYN